MEKEFTIFVDGLPKNMNSNWLRNLFRSFGEIVDVYISFKKRKFTDFVFGFVRFKFEKDAQRAISSFDGRVFKSNVLKVRWAKHRRVDNVIQPSRDSFAHLNEHIKVLLSDCIVENFDSLKKDLLQHVQESILSSLETLLEKLLREAFHPPQNASTDCEKVIETGVVESSFSDDGEAINGENFGLESKMDVESKSSIEVESRNPPFVSCCCDHSLIKEKKKKKRKNKNKQKRKLKEDCFFLNEEWWFAEDFSFSEEEDLGLEKNPNLIDSKSCSHGEIEDESNSGIDEIERSEVLGECNQMNRNCPEDCEDVCSNLEQPSHPPKLKNKKNKENKIFPSSRRPENPRTLMILRPRFLKFALGVCKGSRKAFSRKDTIKYVIDKPPNSRAPLVLKPN